MWLPPHKLFPSLFFSLLHYTGVCMQHCPSWVSQSPTGVSQSTHTYNSRFLDLFLELRALSYWTIIQEMLILVQSLLQCAFKRTQIDNSEQETRPDLCLTETELQVLQSTGQSSLAGRGLQNCVPAFGPTSISQPFCDERDHSHTWHWPRWQNYPDRKGIPIQRHIYGEAVLQQWAQESV